MIKANWDVFSAKFNHDKEGFFEWFVYLLFCREHGLTTGWHGFKNQSAIEKQPYDNDNEVIGFQAKFYTTPLSSHKTDFITMLNTARRDYPNLTTLWVYTNQEWAQSHNKSSNKTIAQTEIEQKAADLNITLLWKDNSFFESELVCITHDDLATYFFTNQNFSGWERFCDWSNTPSDLQEDYLIDEQIKIIVPNHTKSKELNIIDGLNVIRERLHQHDSKRPVRLIGLSGVGKTRFAQALFDKRIGQNSLDPKTVWYCDLGNSPEPKPEHFIDHLKQKQQPTVLIVDNCGNDTHALLTQKIQNSLISLLTIEYDINDDTPNRTDVFKLNPVGKDVLTKVIEKHYPHINSLNSQKIAAASNGNYRLGLAIASNIEQTDNLALLTDGQLFERLFYQAGNINEHWYKAAQYFALVYSFNIEDSGQTASEIDFLAAQAKITPDEAIEIIETLRHKDIVQQRSVWRAILPHALANHLAQKSLQTKLPSQLNQMTQAMPERLQRSFIKRLSYLHHLSKAQELVRPWFASQGWLGAKLLSNSLNQQELEYFRLLAPLAETEILALLQTKYDMDDAFFLRQNNPNFSAYTHLLQRLAYQEENFHQAVILLAAFTRDEKPEENNNPISELIASLFHLYFSRNLATLETKKHTLTHLAQEPHHQNLLLTILDKALDFEHGSVYFYDDDDGQTENYGYQAQTYGEKWQWIEFLLGLLNELDIQGHARARSIFCKNLKHIIWQSMPIDTISKYLQLFHQRQYFSQAYFKLSDIISSCNIQQLLNEIPPTLLPQLQQLQQNLTPTVSNIDSLIRTYINDNFYSRHLKRFASDESKEDIAFFGTYQNLFVYLTNELKNPETLHKHFQSLINISNRFCDENLQQLGYTSAPAFENVDIFIEHLQQINIPEQFYWPSFLAGITLSFRHQSLTEYQKLLVYYFDTEKFQYICTTLALMTCETDEDASYFMTQLNFDLENFGNLFNPLSLNLNGLSLSQLEIIIDALIAADKIELVLIQLLYANNHSQSLPEKYQKFVLMHFDTLLQASTPHSYLLEPLVETLLTSNENSSKAVFEQTAIHFQQQNYIYLDENDIEYRILLQLIQHSTIQFLQTLIDDKQFIQSCYGDFLAAILAHADSQTVLNWMSHDQEKIDFWAKNTKLFENTSDSIVWSDMLIELLNRSQNQSETLNQIFKNSIFKIGVFVGSLSSAMKNKLPLIDSLSKYLKQSHPHLLPEIENHKNDWIREIQIKEKADILESQQQNERFDY